jgi:hypothetical protein
MPISSFIITFKRIFFGGLLFLTACEFHRDKIPAEAYEHRVELIDTTFEYNLVNKLVFSKCTTCHDGFEEQPDLTYYGGIKANLPDIQKMVFVKRQMPPRRAPQLTRCEKDLLEAWIAAGAPETSDEKTPSLPSCGN